MKLSHLTLTTMSLVLTLFIGVASIALADHRGDPHGKPGDDDPPLPQPNIEYSIAMLGALGGDRSNVSDLNDLGQIVGGARTADNQTVP